MWFGRQKLAKWRKRDGQERLQGPPLLLYELRQVTAPRGASEPSPVKRGSIRPAA